MADLPIWAERPEQTAAILNPAILAAVTGWCARRYENECGSPLPWELAYLVAPLALHRATREAMPATPRTHFSAWVNEHAGVLAGYASRARSFAPYVREGLRHGIRVGLLEIYAEGLISATIPKTARPVRETEQADIVRVAGTVGVWFARAGVPANVYIQLGVKP